jgi:hypothetical protein
MSSDSFRGKIAAAMAAAAATQELIKTNKARLARSIFFEPKLF